MSGNNAISSDNRHFEASITNVPCEKSVTDLPFLVFLSSTTEPELEQAGAWTSGGSTRRRVEHSQERAEFTYQRTSRCDAETSTKTPSEANQDNNDLMSNERRYR
jgi:hypothetical protein